MQGWMKLSGAVCILCGAAGTGIWFAGRYRQRILELEQLKHQSQQRQAFAGHVAALREGVAFRRNPVLRGVPPSGRRSFFASCAGAVSTGACGRRPACLPLKTKHRTDTGSVRCGEVVELRSSFSRLGITRTAFGSALGLVKTFDCAFSVRRVSGRACRRPPSRLRWL